MFFQIYPREMNLLYPTSLRDSVPNPTAAGTSDLRGDINLNAVERHTRTMILCTIKEIRFHTSDLKHTARTLCAALRIAVQSSLVGFTFK